MFAGTPAALISCNLERCLQCSVCLISFQSAQDKTPAAHWGTARSWEALRSSNGRALAVALGWLCARVLGSALSTSTGSLLWETLLLRALKDSISEMPGSREAEDFSSCGPYRQLQPGTREIPLESEALWVWSALCCLTPGSCVMFSQLESVGRGKMVAGSGCCILHTGGVLLFTTVQLRLHPGSEVLQVRGLLKICSCHLTNWCEVQSILSYVHAFSGGIKQDKTLFFIRNLNFLRFLNSYERWRC